MREHMRETCGLLYIAELAKIDRKQKLAIIWQLGESAVVQNTYMLRESSARQANPILWTVFFDNFWAAAPGPGPGPMQA